MVDLPTAEGPAKTTSRPFPFTFVTDCALSVEAEALEQSAALTVTEAAQTAGLGDLELLHDLASLDLAHLRHCLEECGDLGLADDLVGLSLVQDLLEVGVSTLEGCLELGALLARLGSLSECFLALFRGQFGNCLLYTSPSPRD